MSAKIAVITMGVKLPGETRGYTRFLSIASMLAKAGFDVDLITSGFQHWDKAQRDTASLGLGELPFKVVFIDEPGYQRNIGIGRIRSHRVAARNLLAYLQRSQAPGSQPYQLIYAEIPPNDVALTAARFAAAQGIPFVVDVNDLWPEAMRMVLDIPLFSDLLFAPFARDAREVYRLVSGVVGTSDEYAARPFSDCPPSTEKLTVYVGNELREFDAGAAAHAQRVAAEKAADAFWVSYAGTLGESYDISTLIKAAALIKHAPPATPCAPHATPPTQPAAANEALCHCGLDPQSERAASIKIAGQARNDTIETSEPATQPTQPATPGAPPATQPTQPTQPATPGAPHTLHIQNQLSNRLELLILGDGPDRPRLEQLALSLDAPVRFMGYTAYDEMAAYLKASDLLVNSLVRKAPQSIVNKIADYLAAGKPMLNTGSSPELRAKLAEWDAGVSVLAEDAGLLAQAIQGLYGDPAGRARMSANARAVAESEFDRSASYLRIVEFIGRQANMVQY